MQHYNFFRLLDSSHNDISDESAPIIVNCGGKTNTDIPFDTVLENRTDFHFLYIVDGSVTAFMDKSQVPLKTGDIVFYHPHQIHHYEFNGDGRITYYWLYFTGKDSQELMERFGFKNQTVINVGVNTRLCDIFEHLISELIFRKQDFTFYAGTYLMQLFLEISRCNSSESHKADTSYRIEKSLQFLINNFKQDISIPDLASIENLSSSRYRYVFKELTGKSPKEYLTDVRMQRARDLLTTTNLSVSDIAELVGYKNMLYFCRIFKQYSGMTASEFRKRPL